VPQLDVHRQGCRCYWGLFPEVEESGEAEDAAGGTDGSLVGDLGLSQIGCGGRGVRSDEGVFLGAEVDLVLIEKILAEVNRIQGIAVKDTLDADLSQSSLRISPPCCSITFLQTAKPSPGLPGVVVNPGS
jgi:hypothetical protein